MILQMYWPLKLSEEFGPNVFCVGEKSNSFVLQLS